MSLRAMLWALYDVPTDAIDPESRLILLVLADHAGHDGRNAWPSKDLIGESTGLSRATVYRRMTALEQRGVIHRGDQSVVMHIPKGKRPVVYDLPMGSHGETPRGRTQRPQGVSKNVHMGSHLGSLPATQTYKPRDKPRPRCEHGALLGADGAGCEKCTGLAS